MMSNANTFFQILSLSHSQTRTLKEREQEKQNLEAH